MTFLDTGIMVGAVLKSHPEHAGCLAALEDSIRPFTNAHAMAETFATLTGFYKVPTDAAAELTLSLRDSAEGSWAEEFMIPCTRHLPAARKRSRS